MVRPRIDYDGLIAQYEEINRTRSLTSEETKELCRLFRRKRASESQRRVRERMTPEEREAYLIRMRKYTAEWKKKNPERVRAYRDKLYAQREKAREEKRRGCLQAGRVAELAR